MRKMLLASALGVISAPLPAQKIELKIDLGQGSNIFSGNGVTRHTVMDEESQKMRDERPVQPISSKQLHSYKTNLTCSYRLRYKFYRDAFDTKARGSISINPVKDKFHVTMQLDDKVSSAFMTPTGTILNYNLVDLRGRRAKKDASEEDTQKQLNEAKQINGPSAYVTYELMTIMPAFESGEWRPKQIVANVYDSEGKRFGYYVYRGISLINRDPHAALDLIVHPENRDDLKPAIGGFSFIDLATFMPTEFVFSVGEKVALTNGSCRAARD